MNWTVEERNILVSRLREIGDILFSPDAIDMDDNESMKLEDEEEDLMLEYAENLPHVAISRCPVCQAELKIVMDLGGLDGPWWWAVRPVEFARHQACEHFQLFLGAMNFGTRNPDEVTETVRVGPGAPFVIPRLLELDGMTAVLSSISNQSDDRIYLVGYFSSADIDDTELHQEWLQESYTLLDDDGEPAFSEAKFDPWDFELAPWFQSGKLVWIKPDDRALELQTGIAEPYLEVQGTRMNQVLVEGELELQEAPHGQDSSMFERP